MQFVDTDSDLAEKKIFVKIAAQESYVHSVPLRTCLIVAPFLRTLQSDRTRTAAATSLEDNHTLSLLSGKYRSWLHCRAGTLENPVSLRPQRRRHLQYLRSSDR